jgi:DeoR/GlpR family transcriptional regulator of sugar metabolism
MSSVSRAVSGHAPPARESKAEARQREITEHVVAQGSSSPQELASMFHVSLMTIHRDLERLERRGVVRRFHGGVTALPSGVFEAQMPFRIRSRIAEKQAIAEAALQLVEPGMSLILDDSTTTLRMIPGLAERGPLHIATTFLEGLRQLSAIAAETDISVIGLGGLYDVPHDSFIGMQCVEQVAALHADALFLSTSAISMTDAFHQEERIVSLKRAMIKAAVRTYLLVDHSKIGRVALHRIAALDAFDLVITDSRVDPNVLAAWTAAGIPFQVAAPALGIQAGAS